MNSLSTIFGKMFEKLPSIMGKKSVISFEQNVFVGKWQEYWKPTYTGFSYCPIYQNTTVKFFKGDVADEAYMTVENSGEFYYENIKIRLFEKNKFDVLQQRIGYEYYSGTGVYEDELVIDLKSMSGSSLIFIGHPESQLVDSK